MTAKIRTTTLALLLLAGIGTLRVDAQNTHNKLNSEITSLLTRMGETLRNAQRLSFDVRTIRVNGERMGDLVHIFHSMKIVVQRPDKLLISVEGDDGNNKVTFDGKNAILYTAMRNQYASIPIPEGTIQGMINEVVGKLDVDMPLADFLADNPNQALLTGVQAGQSLGTVMIDGRAHEHILFSQPPGIFLELWVAKDDPVVPRRLIATYSQLPGIPRFIAEFNNWNLAAQTSTNDFTFQAPSDAKQVELKAPPADKK